MVARRKAEQRRAAAALVRPADVAAIAQSLAPRLGKGVAEGELVTDWLQGLRYLPDSATVDVWQSPLATLARGGGDCEDLVIAALSLLIAMGGGGAVVVGVLFSRRGPIGHAWLEGWDSAGFLHLEATSRVLSRVGRPPGYVPYAVYPPSASATSARALRRAG